MLVTESQREPSGSTRVIPDPEEDCAGCLQLDRHPDRDRDSRGRRRGDVFHTRREPDGDHDGYCRADHDDNREHHGCQLLIAKTPTTAARGGGIPSQAVVAACQADASTVENAVVDYSVAHGIPATSVTVALLTSGPSPYLSSIPTSPTSGSPSSQGRSATAAAPPSAPAVPYIAAGACSKS